MSLPMRIILFLPTILILAAARVAGLAYSGLVDVSAKVHESGAVRWLIETTRKRSVQRRADGIAVPELRAQAGVAVGAAAFEDMCAGCHGAPGREPILEARDMNPTPPDLAELSTERNPAEVFWVIKHGIRMTGMPAWGASHTDSQLWQLVAFIRRMPGLSADEYRQLAQHGGDGHGHGHAGAPRCEPAGHDHGGHVHKVYAGVIRHQRGALPRHLLSHV